MAETNVPNLGHTPPTNAARDAVHVAVAPVVAGMDLEPGWRVGLNERGQAMSVATEVVPVLGLVDPFITYTVRKGQRFWLCLFPGTITGLRHVWSHPAFRVVNLQSMNYPAVTEEKRETGYDSGTDLRYVK